MTVGLEYAVAERTALQSTSTLVIDESYSYLDNIKDLDFGSWTRAARPALLQIGSEGATVGSQLGAGYYNELNAEINPGSAFRATPANTELTVDRYRKALGYSFTVASKGAQYDTVKSLIAGQLTEAVFGGSRDSKNQAIDADGNAIGKQIVASVFACSWCKTRSAFSYMNGDAPKEGFHNFCRCVLMPVMNGLPRNQYASKQIKDFVKLYDSIESGNKTAKELVALARKELGWK